jgi:hypothetical protein
MGWKKASITLTYGTPSNCRPSTPVNTSVANGAEVPNLTPYQAPPAPLQPARMEQEAFIYELSDAEFEATVLRSGVWAALQDDQDD